MAIKCTPFPNESEDKETAGRSAESVLPLPFGQTKGQGGGCAHLAQPLPPPAL